MEKICNKFFCSNVASFVCVRCKSEFYCSKECQILAFPSHRINCFALPELLEIPNSPESPDVADAEGFKEEIKPKSIEGKSPSAQVEPVKGNKSVFRIAFDGGIQTRPPFLYKASVKTVETPIKEFVLNEHKSQYKYKNGCVLSMEQLRQYHKSIAKPLKSSRILIDDLQLIPLPNGKFRATFTSGILEEKIVSLHEACEDVENYLQLIESNIAVHVKKNALSSYKPIKDEVVLAEYEDKFYRAVCKSVIAEEDEFKASVMYIDYGDLAMVSDTQIMPFPASLKFDIAVHSCMIENFPKELSKKHVEIIQNPPVEVEEAVPNRDGSGYVIRIAGF